MWIFRRFLCKFGLITDENPTCDVFVHLLLPRAGVRVWRGGRRGRGRLLIDRLRRQSRDTQLHHGAQTHTDTAVSRTHRQKATHLPESRWWQSRRNVKGRQTQRVAEWKVESVMMKAEGHKHKLNVRGVSWQEATIWYVSQYKTFPEQFFAIFLSWSDKEPESAFFFTGGSVKISQNEISPFFTHLLYTFSNFN